MKRITSVSPFAAAGTEERNAAWILWKAGSGTQEQALEPQYPDVSEPAKYASGNERAEQGAYLRMPIRHEQYNAVVRRIKKAVKQTGSYTQWNA